MLFRQYFSTFIIAAMRSLHLTFCCRCSCMRVRRSWATPHIPHSVKSHDSSIGRELVSMSDFWTLSSFAQRPSRDDTNALYGRCERRTFTQRLRLLHAIHDGTLSANFAMADSMHKCMPTHRHASYFSYIEATATFLRHADNLLGLIPLNMRWRQLYFNIRRGFVSWN